MSDFGKATHADAELILKLYDLRRETVMREARKFIATFNPKSADEAAGVMMNLASQESTYIRQVIGFWEMAASLVLHGAIHEGLFFDNSQEMYFVFARFAPFLAELREKTGQPMLLVKCEQAIQRTSEGRERLAGMIERVKKMAALRAAQAAK